jgi:hypothetical protein
MIILCGQLLTVISLLGIRIRIRIRIRSIRMFLGLPDPHPHQLIKSTDLRLLIRLWILPSSSKSSKKNLNFYCFVTVFMTFYL